MSPIRWRRLLFVGLAGILILSCYAGVRMYQLRHSEIAHALWWTGDIVIRYLRATGGVWPASWEDLETVVRDGDFSRRSGWRWGTEPRVRLPISRLREMVWIDWEADVRQLARTPASADHPPFLVVRPVKGDHFYFSGAEPNEMIRAHLADRIGR